MILAEPVVQPTEDRIEKGDERQERDDHDGDVEGQAPAVDGPAGDGAEQVLFLVFLAVGHADGALGLRDLGLGHKHLGHHDRARCSHDDRGEQVFRLDAGEDIGGHDAAGDVGHAAGHHGHQLRTREAGEKRADGKRRLGLAHEDAGCNIEAFRAADLHRALHRPGEPLDDDLHEADVIKHGKERGDEDDRGQHLKGEDGA